MARSSSRRAGTRGQLNFDQGPQSDEVRRSCIWLPKSGEERAPWRQTESALLDLDVYSCSQAACLLSCLVIISQWSEYFNLQGKERLSEAIESTREFSGRLSRCQVLL